MLTTTRGAAVIAALLCVAASGAAQEDNVASGSLDINGSSGSGSAPYSASITLPGPLVLLGRKLTEHPAGPDARAALDWVVGHVDRHAWLVATGDDRALYRYYESTGHRTGLASFEVGSREEAREVMHAPLGSFVGHRSHASENLGGTGAEPPRKDDAALTELDRATLKERDHSHRGSADFMYVADSKLCTRRNMYFIDEQGGRFVTTVPRSRKEDDDFRNYIQTNVVPWEEVFRKKASRNSKEPDQVYEAVELSMTAVEGFRIVWYRSSVKVALDEKRRLKRIMRARERLERLAERSGAHAFRSVERARDASQRILEEEGAKRWLDVSFTENPTFETKQVSPGRPGPDTEYRRVAKGVEILFHIEENVDVIQADARCDGIFAMMTNDRSQSPADLLATYKYQPFLEKRNQQLKSVLSVAPVFLKKPERVASLLFVYFLAVLIFALVERETRLAMKAKGLESLPLYPEGRPCKAPTADGVFRALESHRRHHLLDKTGVVLRTFHDPVSPVGKQLIKLLRASRDVYGL